MGIIEHFQAPAQKQLQEGEAVLAAVYGTYLGVVSGKRVSSRGVLLATDRRLFFYSKGLFGGFTAESFPYPSISSFEHGKGFNGNFISFFATGNNVSMKGIRTGDFDGLINELESRMNGTPESIVTNNDMDVTEQIKKFAALRDSGILTEEEFSAKKKQLLGI